MASALDTLLRKVILAAAGNETLHRLVSRHGLRLGAARFVAGESFDAAVAVLRRLNEQGLLTNTTLLGERVHDAEETRAVVAEYLAVLDRIAVEDLRTNLAVKPTHVGLALDEELALSNLSELVSAAAARGNFVRMDMEESRWVDATLRLYRRLREAGHDNVGLVLQSCLYRSERDLEELLPLAPNVRLCKGAYLEPPEVAYPRKDQVDAALRRLVERSLRDGGFTALATHDERIVEHAVAFARREGIPQERWQGQMLYGVRPQLQLTLARRGLPVLVATPFGPDWYRYFMRRLAERPANVGFFLRHLLRG